MEVFFVSLRKEGLDDWLYPRLLDKTPAVIIIAALKDFRLDALDGLLSFIEFFGVGLFFFGITPLLAHKNHMYIIHKNHILSNKTKNIISIDLL